MAFKKYYVTVDEEGTTRWYKDTKCKVLHRDDGPAIEWTSGDIEWWQEGQLHRENDPAVEYADGTKRWYWRGLKHRENGPAVEYSNGYKEWWINGKQMTEAEFLAATQPLVELTVADVEKLLGKRVKIIK